MKTLILMVMFAVLLAGCATDKDYAAYLAAQAAANDKAAADQKPLVRLVAQDGQAITGLHSLEVYTPAAAPVIQQARPNEWVGVVQTAVGVTGTVLGIRAAGHAAVGLADSVGRAGTAGYKYIQAPGATTTSTTTTTSTVDSSNHSTTATTDSHNSTATTDSHAVDSHNVDNHTTNPSVQIPGGRICTVDAAGALSCL